MLKWFAVALFTILVVALATLHWVVPGMVEETINKVEPHDPYAIRPEIQELHDSLFVADLHTDTMLWKRDILTEAERGHLDLPRMERGNVALQVFSATTKSPDGQNYESNTGDSDRITMLAMGQMWPTRTWQSIYERAAFQLEKLHEFADRSDGRLVVITNKSGMQEFVDRREAGEEVIAAIYLIEGAHPLEGDIEKLDALFDQGLRVAGLTHFFDNRIGGSLHGISGLGLTEFGREVIRRSDELGITIDVAHASPPMVSDVLAMTSRPVILSHGGVKGLCDQARNLDDDLMKEIAAGGGLIGIGYWAGAVCDITPLGVVRSIRYAIDLMGVDHVALGSDYDGSTTVLFDTSELAILTQTMVDEGFTEAEIRAVMGENVRRFFLASLPD